MIESVDRNYLKLSLALFESNKKEPKKVVTSPFLRLFYSRSQGETGVSADRRVVTPTSALNTFFRNDEQHHYQIQTFFISFKVVLKLKLYHIVKWICQLSNALLTGRQEEPQTRLDYNALISDGKGVKGLWNIGNPLFVLWFRPLQSQAHPLSPQKKKDDKENFGKLSKESNSVLISSFPSCLRGSKQSLVAKLCQTLKKAWKMQTTL